MLDDLSPKLSGGKGHDLLRRLEDKRVNQALPAEMELALLWSIAKSGDLEVEPYWWAGTRRPDAYSESFIRGRQTIIEIAAPSDSIVLTGADAMMHVCKEITTHVEKLRRGLGDYLFFDFGGTEGYSDGDYYRRVLASKDYKLSEKVKGQLGAWVGNISSACSSVDISEKGTCVRVRKMEKRQRIGSNFGPSAPFGPYSLEKNHLRELIDRKADQVKASPEHIVRLLFLADTGLTVLNKMGRPSYYGDFRREKSADLIISNYMNRINRHFDGIVAFSPRKSVGYDHRFRRFWVVKTYCKNSIAKEVEVGVDNIIKQLPAPRFEGYQARSLYNQGAYKPVTNKWYLSSGFKMNNISGEFEIRFSMRAFIDFLSGKISEKEFRSYLSPSEHFDNIIMYIKSKGFTVSEAKISDRRIDDDDDHIILKFTDDPAARELRIESLKNEDD